MKTDQATDGKYILSLDIGTTTISCFAFNKSANVVGECSERIEILYPEERGVEIDPDTLWEQILSTVKGCISDANIKPDQIASLGISTQRSTFILWEKDTGKPLHNFIVWQDTRAESFASQWNSSLLMKFLQVSCKTLHTVTQQARFLAVAVLRFRAQHASMRLLWAFQKYPRAKMLADEGEICFATLDAWLVWKLTKHELFVSEYSCASATGLYDPYQLSWSSFVCRILGIPMSIFPTVLDSSGTFGECAEDFFGAKIPISAVVGDQSAAMYGQCCFSRGDLKLTLGTGAFMNLNIGSKAHASLAGFYPIIGWKIGSKVVHLVEGSSNTCGNAVDWLQRMNWIENPAQSEEIANECETTEGAYFVPNFNGIQAPIIDSLACGSIMGISQKTKPCHIVRAALESLAFRNKQLYDSLKTETNVSVKRFVCDGGVSNNNLVVQLTADLIGKKLAVPDYNEMSALGAAYLAGLAVGYWRNEDELSRLSRSRFVKKPNKETAAAYKPIFQTWFKAMKRSLNWYD